MSLVQRIKALLTSLSSGGKCLTNWMTTQLISQQAIYIGGLSGIASKEQWLFPQLKLTCSTTITGLRFVGKYLDDGNKIPEIQFWRKVSPSGSVYRKVHHTGGDTDIVSERTNLFYMSVLWQVQAGDVLGIYQPDTSKSRYSVAVQEGGGELSYVLKNQRRATDRIVVSDNSVAGHPFPLITVKSSTFHNHHESKLTPAIIIL